MWDSILLAYADRSRVIPPEFRALRPLSAAAWRGLGAEARALTAFLAGRDARAYSRYHHWWAKLPGGEARILPR
jgi:hypothetical protein